MTTPTIAILDNDPAFLSLMHELLTDEGYRTLRWPAGEWARAPTLLRRLRPQLVILDLWMAERDDGWTFLKRLWGDIETTHIPTVVVTGEPHLMPVHADVLHALHCRVLGRPFDLQELLATIAAVLGPSPAQWERGPHLRRIPPAERSVPALAGYPLDVAARED